MPQHFREFSRRSQGRPRPRHAAGWKVTEMRRTAVQPRPMLRRIFGREERDLIQRWPCVQCTSRAPRGGLRYMREDALRAAFTRGGWPVPPDDNPPLFRLRTPPSRDGDVGQSRADPDSGRSERLQEAGGEIRACRICAPHLPLGQPRWVDTGLRRTGLLR